MAVINRIDHPWAYEPAVVAWLHEVYDCHGPGVHGSTLIDFFYERPVCSFKDVFRSYPIDRILDELVDLDLVEPWGNSHPVTMGIGMTGPIHRLGVPWGLSAAQDYIFIPGDALPDHFSDIEESQDLV